MEVKELLTGMSDATLLETALAANELIQERNLQIPADLAGTVAVADTAELVVDQPESTLGESLLEGFDTVYQTYRFLLETVNEKRGKIRSGNIVLGEAKPAPLAVIEADVIRADVEALLQNDEIMQELQYDIDYFTLNPEACSPEPGFDLLIIPEGLTINEKHAAATALQTTINPDRNPYFRQAQYNDERTHLASAKGYYIAFAPKHYNVPSGSAADQTEWMKEANWRCARATKLCTATDFEALLQISNLQDKGELIDQNSRASTSYFIRFDQAPVGGFVSCVFVSGDGRLCLGISARRVNDPARVLVVPKV